MDKATSLARPDMAQLTADIKTLVSRTAENIIAIGEKLQAVRDALLHGEWEPWLREEFDWSTSSALKMMQVSERFKSIKITDLRFDVSALYLLAAPSTPQAAAIEAVQLAQQGLPITPTRAKQLINKHRGVQTLNDYRARPPTPTRAGYVALLIMDNMTTFTAPRPPAPGRATS